MSTPDKRKPEWKQCTAEVIAFPSRQAEVRKEKGRTFRTDIVWKDEWFRIINNG